MRRREFITLLGGAAASSAWPCAARAQTAIPVVGFLDPTAPGGFPFNSIAFHQGLKEAGFVEGENVAIVYRFAENQSSRLPELAAELVRRRVNVIVSYSSGAFAAKAATSTIPIVFNIAEDPVRRGLVTSLSRPDGNLTGVNLVSAELVGKRLELLRDLVPAAKRVAVFVNPVVAERTESSLRDAHAAASAMGLQIQVFNTSTSGEINAAFASFARERPDALLVASDPFFTTRRVQLAHLATLHKIPAAYAGRQFAEVGGLMSYGADNAYAFRQIGVYVGRILKGAKPADLPVIQADKFDLVINAETARMLGLTVPPTLLARADEVIE
jgi:putative ABC transport system substrate-binding protein